MSGTFRRTLQLVAPFKGWMALAILLGFVTIGSGIGLMMTAAYIIARAALHPSIADLQVAIVGVRFFGIARGGLRYVERLVSHHVTFRLLALLRVWFFCAVEPLAPAGLQPHHTGDLLNRVVADIETLEHLFGRVLAPPLVALLVGLSMWFLVGRFDPVLALILMLFLIQAGVGLPLLVRRLSRESGQRIVRLRSELNVALVDGVQGMAELLASGREVSHQRGVEKLDNALSAEQGRMARVAGLQSGLMGLLMNLATLAVLALAIPLVRSAQLNGVSLAVLVLAVAASFEAVLPLPSAMQYLDNSLTAARRIFSIVDAEPSVHDSPLPSPQPAAHGLEVRGLRFRYGLDDPYALDGVSFRLPPGGSLAIVGPSGAGKSTIVNLLLRFWEYDVGVISLGGHPLQDYHQEDVRRLISVVSQRTHLFNATVRENLRLARPDAAEGDLIRAAQRAGIHTFIRSLPQGYDTWVGEQGVRLSAGQRQRLAIARALLKFPVSGDKDTPILILDEATADLDPISARKVMAAINSLLGDRTILIATHRLVGLESVDEILVLRSGRIVERGRHGDLLQMGGLYRRMWDSQRAVLADDRPPA